MKNILKFKIKKIFVVTLSVLIIVAGFLSFANFNSIASAAQKVFTQGGNALGELAVFGTNDNFGLSIKTNNTERVRIDENGSVLIPGGTNLYLQQGTDFSFYNNFDTGGIQLIGIDSQERGKLHIWNGISGNGILDFTSLSTDRNFIFPDQSGTFALINSAGDIEIPNGSAIISGGITSGGDIVINNGQGIHFSSLNNGKTDTYIGNSSDNVPGKLQIAKEANGNWAAVLDVNSITERRNFNFPDSSGTFGLLEADQTFTGINKFEGNANSTVYVGSSIKSGCLVMGDSDNGGVTYITANDGVLMATTTKPNICQ